MDFLKIELTEDQRILVAEFIENTSRVQTEAWITADTTDKGDMIASLCLIKITEQK
jgi:hypothetical protein